MQCRSRILTKPSPKNNSDLSLSPKTLRNSHQSNIKRALPHRSLHTRRSRPRRLISSHPRPRSHRNSRINRKRSNYSKKRRSCNTLLHSLMQKIRLYLLSKQKFKPLPLNKRLPRQRAYA